MRNILDRIEHLIAQHWPAVLFAVAVLATSILLARQPFR